MYISVFDETTNSTTLLSVEELEFEDSDDFEFFFDDKIRKVWHRQKEEWYFSVIDVIEFLTESSDAKQYLKKMRSRDKELNSSWGTICTLTPLIASDGKKYRTTTATMEGILRIIQSIPSKKAEPFKVWLAKVGKERLDEIADPELGFERMVQTYRQKGYSEKWIEQRIHAIDVRKMLTDEWHRSGIEGRNQYAALTNILTQSWSGKTVADYKTYKGLHKENLRDNMTNIELALNQLAEVSATAISKATNPKGFEATKETVIEGGTIAGNARKELESKLGKSVISPYNAQEPALLNDFEE